MLQVQHLVQVGPRRIGVDCCCGNVNVSYVHLRQKYFGMV